MADFLIFARESGTAADIQYQKGDVVEVREGGAPRGGKEAPPQYVWVECPGLTLEQVRDRREEWHVALDYEVIARDLAQDGWRLRVFNTTAAAGGYGALTREAVETFLGNWGAVVQGVSANSVTFDWRVYWGVTSARFWRANVGSIVFSELSYNTSTGIHRIQAEYGAAFDMEDVAARVLDRGGSIVQHVAGRVRFDIGRDVVLNTFRSDITEQARRMVRRRRWAIPAAEVDTIAAFGGVRVVTVAELSALAIDKRAV